MVLSPSVRYLIIAVLVLLLAYRLASRMRRRPSAGVERTGSLIGKTAIVTRTIEPGSDMGRIRVDGREWVARSGERIERDLLVEIVAIDLSVAEVKKVSPLSSHTTGYHMTDL